MRSSGFVLGVALALSAACIQVLGLDDVTGIDGGSDGAGPDAAVCSAQLPCPGDDHCLDGVCVGCLDPAHCGGETPVCDPDAHQCRGCAAHAECLSQLCDLATGVCLPPERAIYVAPNGTDGGGCGTQDAPCKSFGIATAKLTAPRNKLRLLPGVYNQILTLPAGGPWIVIGEGATLDGGALPEDTEWLAGAESNRDVTLDGITIRNAPHSAIRCNGSKLTLLRATIRDNRDFGINAFACELRVSRTLFSFNTNFAIQAYATEQSNPTDSKVYIDRTRFDGNQGGGIAYAGLVDARNNVFVRTGVEYNSAFRGAVSLPGTVIAFNTFVSNVAGFVSIVECGGEGVVSSNVFHLNRTQFSESQQLVTTCKTVAGNYADKDLPPSTERPNVKGDMPGFVSVAADDFHLEATSPLLDRGDPALAPTVDFDGKPRGSAPDIGAFER